MATTTKDQLNTSNPNLVDTLLQALKFGDVLRALPTFLRKKTTVAGATTNYNLATENVLVLPTDAKAAVIHRATVRAATAGTGEAAPQTYGTTPSTGQCAVTPCGDIAFVAGDAPTDFDVVYTPEKGKVVEYTLTCASSVATLPSTLDVGRGVILLMEAEALAATVTGKKIILVPGSGGPATTQARLNVAKTTVTFNNGTDVVTSCRVKLLVVPENDVDAQLEATATSP